MTATASCRDSVLTRHGSMGWYAAALYLGATKSLGTVAWRNASIGYRPTRANASQVSTPGLETANDKFIPPSKH